MVQGRAKVASVVKPGIFASALLGILLLAFAVSVDFPKANGGGFKGDEATYYVLAHSLARDFDFQFERKDLVRVWEEFSGPQGIFLKRGKAIDIRGAEGFPFIRWVKLEDPQRETRLYFSKSYIYPLVAAPFVYLFGTNGFLVLHAILVTLDLLVIYVFIFALTKSNWVAMPLAAAFLGVSTVPVYFIWLVPELFNASLAFCAVFFWAYKEVAFERLRAVQSRVLAGPAADYIAAALIGLATFSKPLNLLLLAPIVLLTAMRFQWKRAVLILAVCGGVTAGLFAANAAITGEFNYQGGDRRTFYYYTGFPFANAWETFDNIGGVHGREEVLVGDLLMNTHSSTVFLYNLWYFVVGRNAGLLPYFFPAVLALVLFLFSKQKRPWQWLALATIVGAIVTDVFMWPFTWNGGGGPIGNRYFLAFYALFLVLIPATVGVGASIVAIAVGALFTVQILANPFFSANHPGEHAKSGPLRFLPVELTLLDDLPVAQNRDRMRQPLGGTPPVFAYFLDDNSFNPEGEWFWVKGRARADVVLRAPIVSAGGDKWISKRIARLNLEVRNGGVPNRVTVSTGRESQTYDMTAGELTSLSLDVRAGVPFRREVQPPTYLYSLTVETSDGFVPFLQTPCEKPGQCATSDPRFLGAMVHVIPEYTDADISTWRPPGGVILGKAGAVEVLDAP